MDIHLLSCEDYSDLTIYTTCTGLISAIYLAHPEINLIWGRFRTFNLRIDGCDLTHVS